MFFLLTLAGCEESENWNGSLEALLASQPERFATILKDPATYRLQILYTQIDRDADNRPSFRSYSYRLDAGEYFYPASTVKLPTAVLALEKLGELNVDGVDQNTVMVTANVDAGKSIGRYIREILLVSDNVAFNSLYEFLGQEPLNERMRELGFAGTRIMHHLAVSRSLEENRVTGPVQFVDGTDVLHEIAAVRAGSDHVAPRPIPLGSAELIGDELVQQPKDFSTKNAYPLQTQHDVIKALMFPGAVPEAMRFKLSDDDYRLLYRYMSAYPRESSIGEYQDESQYPDGYVKFLMFGGDAKSIPDNIRIFNKVGDAYGFLTDAAYIVDFENGIEFILAATIYTNANATFNDDVYEYAEIGFPFMRNLGQTIYEVELRRQREHMPNFAWIESVR